MKMFQKIQELIDDKDALVCVLIDEVGKTPWTVQFLSFVVRSVFWVDKVISWAIMHKHSVTHKLRGKSYK